MPLSVHMPTSLYAMVKLQSIQSFLILSFDWSVDVAFVPALITHGEVQPSNWPDGASRHKPTT